MVVGMLSDAVAGQLIGAVDGLKNALRETLAFADNAQKASLALGQTYEQTRDSLGGTMEGLRGDINQRFGAAIAGMEAGLQGNTAGVAKLINQQQLTGTAYRETAKAFATLEAGMNLSRADTNALSESLIDTGAEYGISTDKLVGAIDALKDTFPAQKLSGMGKDVMGAVASLQAELGPQLAGPLNSVMKSVMDTSEEGFATLTKLGLGGIREQLSAAKSEAEARTILKDAFVTASDTFKMHTAGSDTFFRQIGIATENLGRGAIDFTTVADAFGDRTRQEIDQTADFGKTLSNLKNEILVPFQEGLAVAFPFLLEAMDVISAVMNTVGQRFKKFAESLGGEDGAAATMKKFKLAVIDFSILALGKIEDVFGFMKEKITLIFQSGGTFDIFKMAMLQLTSAVLLAADFLGAGTKDIAENLNISAIKLKGDIDMVRQAGDDKTQQALVQAFIAHRRAGGSSSDFDFTKDFTAKESPINKGLSSMLNQLNNIRSNIESDVALRTRANESAAETAKNTEEINNKTPEIATKSEFLGETASILSESIENILGIGRDTTSEEMLEELKAANIIAMSKEPGSMESKAENSLNG